MHPILARVAGQTFALGDLVLVVGEDQIIAAAVDIDGLAQMVETHRRTLDMPAWPSRPQGLSHDGSPGLADFHSAKSAPVSLRSSSSRRVPLMASCRLRRLSRSRHLLHAKIDIAIDLIGIARFAKLLDTDDLAFLR